jgi:hypothetical protein
LRLLTKSEEQRRRIQHLALAICGAFTVWLAFTASAGAVTLMSQPSVAVRPGTNIEDIAARGSDGHIYYKSFTGSQWTGWTDLGGAAIGMPKVVSWGAGHVDIYVRGTNNYLMHKYWNGSAWSAWLPAGNGVALASDPTAVSWQPGRMDVFARGTSGNLIHAYSSNSSTFSNWESLGGSISSKPTVVSLYAGHLDIYALGVNGQLNHIYFAGSWSGWSGVGLWQYTDAPAVSTWNNQSAQQINVYARGTDGALDESWWSSLSGAWTADHSMGGQIAGTPSTATMNWGHLDVFARSSSDHTLYNRSYSGGWSGWVQRGSQLLGSDPTAVGSPGHMSVYALDAGGALVHTAWYSGGWHAWEYLGQPATPDPYPTSTQYGGQGGAVGTVDTLAEANLVSAAEDAVTGSARTAIWTGLSPADQTRYPFLNPAYAYLDAPGVEGGSTALDTESGASAAAGRLPRSGPDGLWCANHIIGFAYGSDYTGDSNHNNLHTYRYWDNGYSTFLGNTYAIGGHAYAYDCDNGHSRTYFSIARDGRGMPRPLDAVTPEYQVQMVRYNNNEQTKPWINTGGDYLTAIKPGDLILNEGVTINSLPHIEMSPPAGSSGPQGLVKEVRVPVGILDGGGWGKPHTLHMTMHYYAWTGG